MTGAPASGKTTLAMTLAQHVRPLRCIDFGQLLLDRLKAVGPELSYERMRSESSGVISPIDVATVDEELLASISEWRSETNVLIDSHAVTRARFGFRVTASSQELLLKLHLDAVIVLRCEPEELVRRISSEPHGRLSVTVAEATEHHFLQEAIALIYGVVCGCPVFVLDSGCKPDELAKKAVMVLRAVGATISVDEEAQLSNTQVE